MVVVVLFWTRLLVEDQVSAIRRRLALSYARDVVVERFKSRGRGPRPPRATLVSKTPGTA